MDSESALVQRESVVRPWKTWDGNTMGTFEPASILASLPGLGRIDCAQLTGKTIRQLGPDQKHENGTDVSEFIVVSDAFAALVFDDPNHARRWANNTKQVNPEIAASLTYIPSGNACVSLLELTLNLYLYI